MSPSLSSQNTSKTTVDVLRGIVLSLTVVILQARERHTHPLSAHCKAINSYIQTCTYSIRHTQYPTATAINGSTCSRHIPVRRVTPEVGGHDSTVDSQFVNGCFVRI